MQNSKHTISIFFLLQEKRGNFQCEFCFSRFLSIDPFFSYVCKFSPDFWLRRPHHRHRHQKSLVPFISEEPPGNFTLVSAIPSSQTNIKFSLSMIIASLFFFQKNFPRILYSWSLPSSLSPNEKNPAFHLNHHNERNSPNFNPPSTPPPTAKKISNSVQNFHFVSFLRSSRSQFPRPQV